jgi:hypothetical protein
MEMPVVLMERGAKGMNLVARSPREYVTRTLAEEDFEVGVICLHVSDPIICRLIVDM